MANVSLDVTNPLNEDTPDSVEEFADRFNSSVLDYIDEVLDYHEAVKEIEDTNTLVEQLVNLVRANQANSWLLLTRTSNITCAIDSWHFRRLSQSG